MKRNVNGYLGRFDSRQHLKNDTFKQYRLYYLIAAIVAPLFSFVILNGESDFKNLYLDLAVPVVFVVLGILSFYSGRIKNNLKQLFFMICFLLTVYAYLIYVGSGYSVENFLGFLIAFFAILIGINDHRLTLVYSILCLLMLVVLELGTDTAGKPFGFVTESTALVIIGLVGFLIHYNSHKSLKNILYNDGLLNSILNSTADGLLLLDDKGVIMDINKKAESLFNAESKEKYIGKVLTDSRGNAGISSGIAEFLRADNTVLISDTTVNMFEYKGETYKIVVLTDITEKLQKSKELESVKTRLFESEKTYRELFDNSFELIFIVDDNYKMIDINKNSETRSRRKEEDFIGKSFLDIIDGNDSELFRYWFNTNKNGSAELIAVSLFNEVYDVSVRKARYFEKEHFVVSARSAQNRINYENILKDSRDRMTMILENIDSIIYYQEIDLAGNTHLRYISPKIENVIGLRVDEFITLTKTGRLHELVHADDIKLVEEKRSYILTEKKAVDFIYRAKRNDRYVWLEERIYPKFDSKGNHIANFGVSTEVTNAQESKLALQNSNKRNRNFIDRNLAGFYSIDISRNILDCNDAFARIFCFENAEQLKGKNIEEIYKSSSDQKHFLKNIREKGNIVNNESKITLFNDQVIWVLENASLIQELNGTEIIESTIFNITDHKNAELALAKSEEALSMILNNIEDLIYNVEFDGNGKRHFNYLGNQVEKIIGMTKDEYMNNVNQNTISKYIHPDDLPELHRKTLELKEKRINQNFTYRFKKNNKQFIWIEENVFPQFDSAGKIIRLFGVVREISEKKKYEEALIKSEERFRKLFEENLAGVFRTTIDGKILECNNAFVDIFGFGSKDEMIGTSSKELYFTNDDRISYLNDLKKSGNLYNYELCHKRKDGSKVWVLANVALSYNENSEAEFIQGTLINISGLKSSNEALAESEEKFRLLFEATDDAIMILDNDIIIDCNDKSLETFGCSLDEKSNELAKKSRLYEMSPKFQPDGVPSFEKLDRKIKELWTGDSLMFYWRFTRKDGALFDAEVSLNVFQIDNHQFIQAIIRDITARMKAENALRESEDRFKMLSNVTIEGIIFTDEGQIIDSNEQFAFMYGYSSRNQLVGKNINEFLYSKEDVDKVKDIISNQSEEKFEVRSKRKDGALIWVESKGRMIPYHGKRLRVSVIYDITDRKLKEQELQDSRESFMNLTELSPNGSIIHIDGIIQYANPTVLQFLGYNHSEELLGKNIISLLEANEQQKSLERIERIKKGESVGFTEFRVKNKTGKFIETGVQSVRITHNGKEAIHVIIIDLSQQKELQNEKMRAQLAEETNLLLAKQVQERKDAEQRLWETQMFTTNMFNSSLDMIMASDKQNLITQVNSAVIKTFGYKTEEMIGLHPKHLYATPEDFEVVRLSLLNNGTFSGEIRNITKDGNIFISYLSASVLKNTQGKIIGTMGVSRDITETLLSQRKIQEQNAQIRSIFDNASNMLIWTIDRAFNLVAFNNNFNEILYQNFGVRPEKGMSIVSLLTPLLNQELIEVMTQSFNTTFDGKNSELEGPFRTSNGRVIWIETFLNPIFLEDGSINEISCISHEITEKKEAESQIRQSLKEKEVLLKEVHHRVKNNLQVISSILNLQSSYVSDENTLSILRESQNRIKSMSFIHESLYQTKNFSSINFSEYIINLSNNLFHSYQIFDNFIELKLDVAPVELNLDQAIPCGLIVNEIITNALKYAFVGRKKGLIFIGIEEKDKTIMMRIEDNGKGLPKGLNYRKTATLGLQLVVTLVEQLDGKLDLKSEKGTKYLITFDKLN